MSGSEQLHIHCTSEQAHEQLLSRYSADILRLSERQHVRIYSPLETREQGKDDSPKRIIINELEGLEDVELNISKVVEHLQTSWLGKTIIYVNSTPSTQDIFQKALPRFGHGWIAVSGCQTNGRGRRGTSWTSPLGSVALSIGLRIGTGNVERLTFVQYIAALAAAEICTHDQWSNLNINVKWPNDIYLNDKKVGGVLCECVMRDGIFHLVVGVGVNVSNEHPTTCLMRNGGQYIREIFLANYVSAFETLYNEFCDTGFSGRLERKYLEKWIHTGQSVQLGSVNGPKATVTGLAPNGWVRVFREDWQAFQDLPPEDTSLDVHNNIIKKKC